ATMREEAGDALEYYRRIKEIFDPDHIMNTGKKWEDDPRPAGRDEE
ncbi:MAG: FAD-binding oxidoreductase, partial [Thermoplasmata archaeon]|nr:FAD-binding oxidoreductase [Thermoplasmata archaeon]